MDSPSPSPPSSNGPSIESVEALSLRKAQARVIRRNIRRGPDAHPLVLIVFSLMSAGMMALSLPNELFHWGSPLIGLFALVPLFTALSLRPGLGLSFLVGALYGAAAHAASSYWLWFFKDFALWTLGSTTLAYAVVYGFVCAWLALAASSSKRWRALLLALGWTAYEFQKSIGFLAYPWGLIPYSWNTVLPFIQLADITGIYGPGLILSLAAAVMSDAALKAPSALRRSESRRELRPLLRAAAIVASAFALSLAYGGFRLIQAESATKTLRVVVVQANEDSWGNRNEYKRINALIDLTEAALAKSPAGTDLILWSENSLTHPYDYRGQGYNYGLNPKPRSLHATVAEWGVPLLTGATDIDFEAWKVKNAVSLAAADASFVGSYAKMHCVPFAEAIPFIEQPWMQRFMEAVVGISGGYEIGDEYRIFTIPLLSGGRLSFATPICFEDAFADICRDMSNLGAEVLVNLTNDSWSRTASAEIQHLVAARFRSVENRRVLLRSTNAGVSCWVDPKGRIRDMLPLFEPLSSALSIPVSVPRSPTVYSRAGEAFPWAVTFFFAIFSFIFIYKKSRDSRRITP